MCVCVHVCAYNVPPIAKVIWSWVKVRKTAKIRKRYNQVPHLTQDKVSSARLEKLGIEPVIPGLQGERFIHYTMAALHV